MIFKRRGLFVVKDYVDINYTHCQVRVAVIYKSSLVYCFHIAMNISICHIFESFHEQQNRKVVYCVLF